MDRLRDGILGNLNFLFIIFLLGSCYAFNSPKMKKPLRLKQIKSFSGALRLVLYVYNEKENKFS